MKYDVTIVCSENDYYLGDLICQEMEALGKSVLFNLRDAPRPDVLHKFICKSPVYIAVINNDFLTVKNFVILTKYECTTSELKSYLFVNEDSMQIPKDWGNPSLVDANAGLDDALMDAIASGQDIIGLCDMPIDENDSPSVKQPAPKPSIHPFVADHRRTSVAVQASQTEQPADNTNHVSSPLPGGNPEIDFGRHERDRIADMLLPEEPSSMMVRRAMKYFRGQGVVRDLDRSYSLLKKAIAEDPEDVEALYYLGVFSESDEVGLPEHDVAKQFYKLSFEKGFIPSMLRLGYLTMNGMMPDSGQKALEIFKQCRKAGDFRASYWLGYMAEMKNDMENAFEYYSEAAEEGYAPGQNALGCMYIEGKEVRQDERKAFEWFRLAAEQRLPVAMANLGDLMIRMNGMSGEARELIRLAGEARDQRGIALSLKLDRYDEEERQEAIRKRKEAERQAQMESLIDTVGDTLGRRFGGSR